MKTPPPAKPPRKRSWLAETTRVGLVLTGVTCLVLVIGFSMIRHVSGVDSPAPIEPGAQSAAPINAPQPGGPEKLVLRPSAPDSVKPQPPSANQRSPVFDVDGDRY